MKTFWREVQSMNNKVRYSRLIDGKNDNHDIISIFDNKFLINNEQLDYARDETNLLSKLHEQWNITRKMNLKISSYSLRRLIRKLKTGMGHDGIHSNYLKRVADKFLNNLAYLLNACYTLCYIPSETLVKGGDQLHNKRPKRKLH